MQRFTITKGSTSQIIPVSIYDSSSTTGGKLTGLVYNSAGLTAYYYRQGAGTGATAITLATATLGTYTSGGFIAIDGTNMPGDYEIHLPNAILASGANNVLIQLKGATNMVPVNIEIDLVDRVGDLLNTSVASYITAGTVGEALALGSAALVDSTITGTPTSTTFTFTGGNTNNNFYNDQLVYILSGTGAGQVRPVSTSSYSAGTTTITVDEAWITTPAAADRFAVIVSHVHTKTQIQDLILNDATPFAGADIGTINTNTTNLRNVVKKNTVLSNVEFLMVDSTDHVTPKTGLTVTGQRSIDGGAFAAVSGTIAEVGSGIYQFDALAADTNGGIVTWKFSSTGADDRFITIITTA